VIPEKLWGCGSSLRVLDISRNSIHEIPSQIGSLNSIQFNSIAILIGWFGLSNATSCCKQQ
ncbi:hypothetical protein MKX03_002023, partial [Papaver bracteatum]